MPTGEHQRARRRANGEGTITQRKDGRWEARISLANGKRKTIYGKSQREVRDALIRLRRENQQGLPVRTEQQTLETFLESWLQNVRPSLRPRTFVRYCQYIRIGALPELGRIRIDRLTPQHLSQLYANRLKAGSSPSTVRHTHVVLRRALEQACRWGLVPRNVADLVDPPRIPRHEMATLSPEEARRFLAAADGDRLEALYVLALTCGLRQGELLALHWRDVDLDRESLQVRGTLGRHPEGLTISEPKTSRSRRQLRLSRAAVGALRKHRAVQNEERLRLGSVWDERDLVFPNEIGRPIEAGNLVRRSFSPLLKRAGVPRIRFHDLRHTAASLLLAEGKHPKIVADMLGHSQIGITLDLYSHVTPTLQQEAADAMDRLLGT